jgi:hypothetical protein
VFVSDKKFQASLNFLGTRNSLAVKAIQLPPPSVELLQNKLVCLSLTSISQAGLIFAGKVKSLKLPKLPHY